MAQESLPLKKEPSLKKKSSLFVKAIISISLVLIVIITAVSAFVTGRLVNDVRIEKTSGARVMLALQAQAVAAPLWNFEDEIVMGILKGLEQWPDFQAVWIVNAEGKKGKSLGKALPSDQVIELTEKITFVEDGEKQNVGAIVLQLSEDSIIQKRQTFILAGVIIALVLLIAVQGPIVLILRNITRPLVQMTNTMEALANGKLDVDVPARERNDEIGHMAQAVDVFKENAQKLEQSDTERKKRVKERAIQKSAEMRQLAEAFNAKIGSAVEKFSQTAESLKSAAQTMNDVVQRVNESTTHVSDASGNVASNVETVAMASSELSNSINEISSQAATSNQVTQNASDEVRNTNAKIQELAEGADKIGSVVQLISDISEQTNLLALNATIEAARAGEMGKGFAVVAGEVKNLANQTAKATDSISEQIQKIQAETGHAVHAIQGIDQTIAQITQVTGAIAAAVEEQGAATNEITNNIERISSETNTVTGSISAVSRDIENADMASAQVTTLAEDLSQRSDELKRSVAEFIESITSGDD